MSGAKHTPAPWRVKPGDEGPEVWGLPFGPAESEYPIALLSDDWGEDTDSPESFHQQQQKNAALIAAAPDLLEALSAIVDGLDWELLTEGDRAPERVERHQRLLAAAEAAIAKAEGQS